MKETSSTIHFDFVRELEEWPRQSAEVASLVDVIESDQMHNWKEIARAVDQEHEATILWSSWSHIVVDWSERARETRKIVPWWWLLVFVSPSRCLRGEKYLFEMQCNQTKSIFLTVHRKIPCDRRSTVEKEDPAFVECVRIRALLLYNERNTSHKQPNETPFEATINDISQEWVSDVLLPFLPASESSLCPFLLRVSISRPTTKKYWSIVGVTRVESFAHKHPTQLVLLHRPDYRSKRTSWPIASCLIWHLPNGTFVFQITIHDCGWRVCKSDSLSNG